MTTFRRLIFAFLLLLCATNSFSRAAVQIEGELSQVSGKPRWLIVLRDPDNGSTTPWMYEFKNTGNHWLVLPTNNTWQIVASNLLFGDNNTIFHNFCGIEDGLVSGKSMQIILSGQLSPTTNTIRCHVVSYPAV